MMVNVKKEFFKHLKKYNVWLDFCQGFVRHTSGYSWLTSDIDEFMTKTPVCSWISYAFLWSDYNKKNKVNIKWDVISKTWIEHCESKLKILRGIRLCDLDNPYYKDAVIFKKVYNRH